jgi:hypothetical protein
LSILSSSSHHESESSKSGDCVNLVDTAWKDTSAPFATQYHAVCA